MTNKYYENESLLKLIFVVFFTLIWGSLDTNFENTSKFFDNFNIVNTILFLRSTFLPFLFFLIICIFFIKRNNSKINIKILKKFKFINLIFFLFSFLLLIQLISHVIYGNKLIFLYYFFISFFLVIYFIFAVYNNLLNLSFYISLFILFCLFLFFGFLSFKHFFTNGDLHLYGTFPSVYKSILTVSSNTIRSSGLSRIAMLIYIPFFLYLMLNPVSKKLFLINFILIFILLLTQSRLTNLYWFLFLIFSSFWFLRDNKFFIYTKKIMILLIIPFLITGGLISAKYYLLYNKIIIVNNTNDIIGLSFQSAIKIINEDLKIINEDLKIINEDLENSEKRTKAPPVLVRPTDGTISSGRTGYWNQILKKNKHFLIGNGYLGDRFLINHNASNILVYTFASSGLLGSIIIIILISRCVLTCFDLMFIKKINFNKKNIIIISSIFYLAFLTFRGIGENSYAVFSIDMIIFLQSLMIVELFKSKLEISK